MSKTIQVELTDSGINKAVKELRQYSAWIQRKEDELRSQIGRAHV